MNLNLRRPARPFPVATQTRDGDPYEHMHPRLAAIRLLREHIADGRAGLDPFDPSIFVFQAAQHEKVWAYRALELLGTVLTRIDQLDGTQRLRAVVEADIRVELGLDRADAPYLDDVAPIPTLHSVPAEKAAS